MRISFGRIVRIRRYKEGHSQESFADAVGLHRTYVGAVERGERNVSLHNLVKIANALRIPLSRLVGEAEEEAEEHGG